MTAGLRALELASSSPRGNGENMDILAEVLARIAEWRRRTLSQARRSSHGAVEMGKTPRRRLH